jgi:hypothetical protein
MGAEGFASRLPRQACSAAPRCLGVDRPPKNLGAPLSRGISRDVPAHKALKRPYARNSRQFKAFWQLAQMLLRTDGVL